MILSALEPAKSQPVQYRPICADLQARNATEDIPMPVRVTAARNEDLPAVRQAMHDTFCPNHQPGPLAPFYVRYEVCDPDFQPEQYRFRRLRGRVASLLKVFVRRLHHPSGPLPVTIIGGVCTREEYRGRGLIGPVIRDSLEYSRSLGAKAEIIVTPRKDYYLRHGFTYVTTHDRTARIPDLPAADACVEPLRGDDAGWMTELFNGSADGYGPIVRTETYTRKWLLEMRLASADMLGLKLLRRGRPAAYGIFNFRDRPLRIMEVVSKRGDGRDEAALLSFCRTLGRDRFAAHVPARHPLIRFLAAARVRVRAIPAERYMYLALDPSFPVPDQDFIYSWLDFV